MSGDQVKCLELLEAKEFGLLELELPPDAAKILRKTKPLAKAVIAKLLIERMHKEDPIPTIFKFML